MSKNLIFVFILISLITPNLVLGYNDESYKTPEEIVQDYLDKYGDSHIIEDIIQESIYDYPGPCPCPYHYAGDGSLCGSRSAYEKDRGYEPICYPEDVTQDMIEDYILEQEQ